MVDFGFAQGRRPLRQSQIASPRDVGSEQPSFSGSAKSLNLPSVTPQFTSTASLPVVLEKHFGGINSSCTSLSRA
jgi:hypothetical protein